jgi:hypothetical protein
LRDNIQHEWRLDNVCDFHVLNLLIVIPRVGPIHKHFVVDLPQLLHGVLRALLLGILFGQPLKVLLLLDEIQIRQEEVLQLGVSVGL